MDCRDFLGELFGQWGEESLVFAANEGLRAVIEDEYICVKYQNTGVQASQTRGIQLRNCWHKT